MGTSSTCGAARCFAPRAPPRHGAPPGSCPVLGPFRAPSGAKRPSFAGRWQILRNPDRERIGGALVVPWHRRRRCAPSVGPDDHASMRPGANRRDHGPRTSTSPETAPSFNEARRESPGSRRAGDGRLWNGKRASMRPGANRRDHGPDTGCHTISSCAALCERSPNVLTASPTEPLETRHYPVSALERSQRRGGAGYR